jgi:hypothetical protein
MISGVMTGCHWESQLIVSQQLTAKTIDIADIDSQTVVTDLVSSNPVHEGLFA